SPGCGGGDGQKPSQMGQPRLAPQRVVASGVPVGRPTSTSSQVPSPTSPTISSPLGPKDAREGLRSPIEEIGDLMSSGKVGFESGTLNVAGPGGSRGSIRRILPK